MHIDRKMLQNAGTFRMLNPDPTQAALSARTRQNQALAQAGEPQ